METSTQDTQKDPQVDPETIAVIKRVNLNKIENGYLLEWSEGVSGSNQNCAPCGDSWKIFYCKDIEEAVTKMNELSF